MGERAICQVNVVGIRAAVDKANGKLPAMLAHKKKPSFPDGFYLVRVNGCQAVNSPAREDIVALAST